MRKQRKLCAFLARFEPYVYTFHITSNTMQASLPEWSREQTEDLLHVGSNPALALICFLGVGHYNIWQMHCDDPVMVIFVWVRP